MDSSSHRGKTDLISRILTREADKRKLITRLSRASWDLALYYPDLDDLPPGATRIRADLALIRAPYDYETLDAMWAYGNWNLIHPPRLDFPFVNTFRLREPALRRVLSDFRLTILVDSFHDNIEWKVCELA